MMMTVWVGSVLCHQIAGCETPCKRILARDSSLETSRGGQRMQQPTIDWSGEETKRARVTVATAMETVTKASDGDEGNGDNGGG